MIMWWTALPSAFATEELSKAKPGKIVAGQEAERTNVFLQRLGMAVLKKVKFLVIK